MLYVNFYISIFLLLEMVCIFVPSPLQLSEEKIKGIMCSSTLKFDVLPEETRALKQSMYIQFNLFYNQNLII